MQEPPLRLRCQFSAAARLSCLLENQSAATLVVSDYLVADPAHLEVRGAHATSGVRLSAFSPLSAGATSANLRTLAPGETLPRFFVELPTVPSTEFVIIQHLGNDGSTGWSGAVTSNPLKAL